MFIDYERSFLKVELYLTTRFAILRRISSVESIGKQIKLDNQRENNSIYGRFATILVYRHLKSAIG